MRGGTLNNNKFVKIFKIGPLKIKSMHTTSNKFVCDVHESFLTESLEDRRPKFDGP